MCVLFGSPGFEAVCIELEWMFMDRFAEMMRAVVSGAARWESPCAVAAGRPGLAGSGGVRGVSGRRRGRSVGVRCEVVTVDEGNFEREVLKSEVPVLVDFWATWCGPCKLVAKSVDSVERKYAGKLKVVKVETDPNPTLKQTYRVYGLPTLIMFRDGKEVDGGRFEGAISETRLESMLMDALPSLAAT